VAERDGLFTAAGAKLAALPLGARGMLVAALLLDAVVTAVLNLDTAVFFVTPVLVHLARVRGIDETPFLYGSVFMANSASLFLPGSNLTNLIVFHHAPVSGATFLARLWPAASAAVLVTIGFMLAVFWSSATRPADTNDVGGRARLGLGVTAVAVSAALILALTNPALPVLACGIAAVLLGRVRLAAVADAMGPRTLGALFVVAVTLGALGRSWHAPAHALDTLSVWPTAAFAAVVCVAINNLPAAVLLTPHQPHHARALLLGLNLGPNLAVSGSLSALLWLRVARRLGASPSIFRYTRLGVVLVPLTLAATLAVSYP
jgi:arsenical pump membrane protein